MGTRTVLVECGIVKKRMGSAWAARESGRTRRLDGSVVGD
jgi:hypothetical protein